MMTVTDLSFAFGSRTLFRDVSFNVQSGELIRIAGPNGVGKSTFLNILAGLISDYKGTVEYLDEGSLKVSRVWLPPDSNGLYPTLSALKNLQFWSKITKGSVDDKIIRSVLREWGLNGTYVTENLTTCQFSTGMKRRLALARLEISDARIWLLDEPLFGLDQTACDMLKTKLERHLKLGGAAIVVTHDNRLIDGVPSRSIVLGDQS